MHGTLDNPAALPNKVNSDGAREKAGCHRYRVLYIEIPSCPIYSVDSLRWFNFRYSLAEESKMTNMSFKQEYSKSRK